MAAMRALHAVPSSTQPAPWLTQLRAALDGSGPALLPVPEHPDSVRLALLTALRPDDPQAPLERADIALVVPTSGSTGVPKGAQLSATALRASAAATHARLDGPGHWVLALPLTHIAGFNVLTRSLDAGTDPVAVDLSAGFTPQAFAAAWPAHVDGPVYTALVPTQLTRLLDAGTDLSRYAAILLGGSAAPDALLARAHEAGARIVTTYGMSETSGGCVYDSRPLDGVRVSIGADGRIELAGPMLFAGYRLRPDLTSEVLQDGRLRTQDLGHITEDGLLQVLGRADDIVITGGVNVAAGVVSHLLASHPKVKACLVVGVADIEWGERLVAVVEPVAAQDPVSLEQLRAFAASRLEPAALPMQLVLVPHLPLLASGKPDRERIRAYAAAAG
jgi:O-succinylbenzoic acid--CoA ligase